MEGSRSKPRVLMVLYALPTEGKFPHFLESFGTQMSRLDSGRVGDSHFGRCRRCRQSAICCDSAALKIGFEPYRPSLRFRLARLVYVGQL
jgi:hypothetical protein